VDDLNLREIDTGSEVSEGDNDDDDNDDDDNDDCLCKDFATY